MSNEQIEPRRIPDFVLQVGPGVVPVTLFLGNNWVTAPILVGDRIKDQKTGRVFEAVRRTWLAGEDREANMAVLIKELPTE